MAKSKSKSKSAPAVPAAPSSNWKALKSAIKPNIDSPDKSLKRKRRHSSVSTDISIPSTSTSKGKEKESDKQKALDENAIREKGLASKKEKKMVPVEEIMAGGKGDWQKETGHYLALDCEMVGVGPSGVESTLARVSIVNYHGHTVMDRFVRPREKVTDYRTWVSGVREEDLRNAPSFQEVQKEVAELLKDRILVGHALSNDTNVLLLSHPWHMTRDTSNYSPLQGLTKTKKPSLRTLAKLVLGVDIQAGEHSSVTDARATMAIYRSQKSAWEDSLLKHTHPVLLTTTTTSLLSLDYAKISLTGVGKKKNLAGAGGAFGVSTILRHVRNERELLEANGGTGEGDEEEGEIDEEKEEELERERRKKRRTEKDGDMVLGFDFEKPKPQRSAPPVEVPKANGAAGKKAGGGNRKGGASAGGGGEKKYGAIKGGGVSFKGDREKRPQSKSGWWEED
ncbi:putative 3'-5' exonuclease [Sporobolomyces salmoneus]|uniref:putative 3'-5' exonuclease n=1 Tax=Sporobolomyces salmoneus TaxID=183962 RepID=UPI00316CA060